ncbi:DedA family protein [Nannocystis punicea]|uniref:VTT domain-containing protein n=1 Tax=Nannocystis punicea TaxID=2995304 RepID=A0ABY7HHN1_9BACT|nr:VTT domain-containing protein [Nannocystis poenicansa]WAS98819.1 VTT domain-containing protein [Nannocystis poenicansa]
MEQTGWLALLLASGIAGIGAAAFAEKLVPVFPSYVLYVWVGMHAVPDALRLALIILVASVGSTLGAVCWYAIGRALGPRRTEALVVRLGRRAGLDAARYSALAEGCRSRPFALVLLGQVTPGVRLCVPLIAGVLELRAITFFSATLLGNAAWNAPLIGLGYALRGVSRDPAQVGLAVVAALVVLEGLLVVAMRRRRRA